MRSLSGRSLTIAVLAGCLLPSAAGAAIAPKYDDALSPILAELAKPSLRSKSPQQQATILGVAPSGPGSLVREGGRVLIDVRFDRGALSRQDDLSDAGASIVAASRRYQRITARISPAALPDVAAVPGVASVTPVRAPILYAEECEGGSVISEGVNQLKVKTAREEFGVDGAGVTVGVLSDSYDKATEAVSGGAVETKAPEDVETEDLPGTTNNCAGQKSPVDVLEDLNPPTKGFDEGRAMLQIVHDVAPAANLAFATAFEGELSFAQNIERLAEPTSAEGAEAKVIVDDVGYFEEPFFQDGPVAAAVNKVTGEGVTYLSAAGNDNLFDSAGREIASWEAPAYRDAGSCPAAVAALKGLNGSHCMDFAPGAETDTAFGITVEPEEILSVDLQWNEPWFGVGTNLDAFLLNSGGQILRKAVENNSGASGTQTPVEIIQWPNESSSPRTVQFVVNRFSGGAPRLKFILLQNGGGVSATEYPSSSGGDVVGPSIFGHSGSASAIGVGAIRFNKLTEPERYSSRGPVTHYFGEVKGTSPAAPLGSGQVIPKPDVTATDCGATTFFARFFENHWRFCGTSAAAPHAAGVAALMVQAAAGGSPGLDEPGPIRNALLSAAVPIGSFGSCAVGAGLLEAAGAVEGLLAGPEAVSLSCLPPASAPLAPMPPATSTAPTAAPAGRPSTFFARHPPKVVRTGSKTVRLTFRFGSDQSGVTFLCKIDRAAFRGCPAKLVRRFVLGRHVLRVKARNAAGRTDATPAVFRFRVERIA